MTGILYDIQKQGSTAWESTVAFGNTVVIAANLSSGGGKKITIVSHFLRHEILKRFCF